MRAREPDREGYAEYDGVKVFYEVFGDGEPTVVFVHGWQIAYSRLWKMQVPYFARHFRVITFDFPGNGRSDRPTDSAAYSLLLWPAYVKAVLDATSTDRAVVVGVSGGGIATLLTAATFPDQVEAIVVSGFGLLPDPPYLPEWALRMHDELTTTEGKAKWNCHYMARDYPDFLQSFIEGIFPEPHSTKAVADFIGWGLETSAETIVAVFDQFPDAEAIAGLAPVIEGMCREVRCPALFIHGTEDQQISPESGHHLAGLMGADFVLFEGSGHAPLGRDPVRFNLVLKGFIDRVHPPAPRRRRWARALQRPKRALFVSSPIGLGHALRDVAIAGELRRLRPELEVQWLAQHPVTEVLRARGEIIHPASAGLASESAHIEAEAVDHDLHAFQALRRMDEILLANFMVFSDLLEEETFDLVVADEAWDLDHFLHENPERKRSPLAWLTDFVGFLPMPDGGEHEACLTADYNAEMVELVARYPSVRDRAIFVGNPNDLPDGTFGPGLPGVREWTEGHFAFAGYVTGFERSELADREVLRAQLGYRPGEPVCVVTVGGSGVGERLLRRVLAAWPAARAAVSDLHLVVVAGPRIDPASLAAPPEVEVHGYLPDLWRHLAACDYAVVQGGLTTCMELTAAARPFCYVPLRHHFEQQLLIPRRLANYRAGRRLDYDDATPEALAAVIAAGIGQPVNSRPVEADGATRAAALIAELV
jgi:pimeloyl-ACP methyl ester carboxylesterase/predicted glycosyltransferase